MGARFTDGVNRLNPIKSSFEYFITNFTGYRWGHCWVFWKSHSVILLHTVNLKASNYKRKKERKKKIRNSRENEAISSRGLHLSSQQTSQLKPVIPAFKDIHPHILLINRILAFSKGSRNMLTNLQSSTHLWTKYSQSYLIKSRKGNNR